MNTFYFLLVSGAAACLFATYGCVIVNLLRHCPERVYRRSLISSVIVMFVAAIVVTFLLPRWDAVPFILAGTACSGILSAGVVALFHKF